MCVIVSVIIPRRDTLFKNFVKVRVRNIQTNVKWAGCIIKEILRFIVV